MVGRVRGVQAPGDRASGATGGQYFSTEPASAPARRTITLTLPDVTIDLLTDRGVFSGDRVDPGTKLLLSTVPAIEPAGARVLDLGCGYGPIAVVAGLRVPDAEVWAVDVNARARELCTDNAAASGCANVRVAAPGDVPADLRFDVIWSNPPIRIGKPALHELLRRWLTRLTPDTGRAWLVVQKHLGSDSLMAWLQAEGWPTTRLTSRQAYRILEVSARGEPDLD